MGGGIEQVSADNLSVSSGSWGDNFTWNLDRESGVLTLTGSGKLQYPSGDLKFDRELVKSVVFPQGWDDYDHQALLLISRFPYVTSFVVEEGNEHFVSEDGILYTKDKTILLAYPDAKTDSSFDMPDTVLKVYESAFGVYSHLGEPAYLKDITLSENLQEIGPGAFSGCGFTKLVLPKSLVRISGHAFGYCTSLQEFVVERDDMDDFQMGYFSVDGVLYRKYITNNLDTNQEERVIELVCYPDGKEGSEFSVPSGVTLIGYSAFFVNPSLKTVKFPVTVQSVNFYDSYDSGIQNFYIPGTASCKNLSIHKEKGKTFYGKAGSDAHRCALENEIQFVETADPPYVEPEKPFVFDSQTGGSGNGNGGNQKPADQLPEEDSQTGGSGNGNGGNQKPAGQLPEEDSQTGGLGNGNGGNQKPADQPTKEAGQKALKLSAASLPLQLKKSTNALFVTAFADGDAIVKWESSKPEIVSVNASSGTLKALKKGNAVITVTMKSGAQASCTVKVQKGAVKTKKLTLSVTRITLKKGKSYTLTVQKTPLTSKEKLTFTSSNKKTAVVSKKGVIKAKKKGKASITVKAGKAKKTCKVTVK